jgi:hypothetical protein
VVAGESEASAAAYVPLSFAPGEAYQFDWSHEIVVIDGVTTTVKVAHVRLCHSRMPFVRAYPRETQEMVFDAHDKAFAFFGGACARGIYDNMKTAVDAIFVGKDRAYNRRFQQMCGHYLVEPVACTPARAGRRGRSRTRSARDPRRFFVPRPGQELRRAERLARGPLRRLGQGASAPGAAGQDDLGGVRGGAAEPGALCGPLRRLPCRAGRGVEDLPRPLRQQPLLGRARAVGRPVEIRAYADRVEMLPGRRIVGEHARAFGRGKTVYDPWHYVPVLARKPGALRNGAPFKDWDLPPALRRVQRKLRRGTGRRPADGRHPRAVLTDGLEAVEAACAEALERRASIPPTSSSTSWPAARAGRPATDRDTGRAAADPRAGRRLRPLRQPEEAAMERIEIWTPWAQLKLYGMKAAYDEIIATGRSSASTSRSRSSATC